MIRKLLLTGLSCLVLSVVNTTQAVDLIEVYHQAVQSDPTFKQAQSTWWSAKQNFPIAVAAYLPQVEVTDVLQPQYSNSNPPGSNDGWKTNNVFTVSATQAIFDYSVWTNIREQAASVRAATATYLAAAQDLMARTVTAYFDVLQAFDKLRFTLANIRAVKRQLVTAEEQFKVGLIAITGVYDAQSRYDQANANEISDRNNLYNKLEDLRAITGQHYLFIQGVPLQVPLITPQPNDINRWVSISEKQNYSLKSQQYTVQQAHEDIFNKASGFLPSVEATGSYALTNNWDYQNPGSTPPTKRTRAGNYGLSLTWDPFSGGATYFSTKQARYNYVTALGKMEAIHRSVVSETRQAFLGIKSGISRIQADKQSIMSARNALKATEAGYNVGTRTMVDVLNDLSQVYNRENTYMDDQYAYIDNLILLKQQAGTLSVEDVRQINSWLKKLIQLPLPKSMYGNLYAKLGVTESIKASQYTYEGERMNAKPSAKQMPKAKKKKSAAQPKPTTKPQAMTQLQSHRTGYVVQLYSAASLKDARRFAAHSALKKQLRIVRYRNLYKVLYGDYPTRADALIALDAMSTKKHKVHGWVFKIPEVRNLPIPA